METIYLHTISRPRPSEKVVDLRTYQERKALLLDGAAVPALPVLPEVTPERVEQPSTEDALRHFLLWADAVASVVLIAGALLVLAAIL